MHITRFGADGKRAAQRSSDTENWEEVKEVEARAEEQSPKRDPPRHTAWRMAQVWLISPMAGHTGSGIKRTSERGLDCGKQQILCSLWNYRPRGESEESY